LMKRNVSSFATNSCPQGGGTQTIGGMASTAQLEVPILTPFLSVMAPAPLVGCVDPIRFPEWATSTAGDPIWAGYVASNTPLNLWNYKRHPKFHFIDFLEIGDVMAQFVQALQNTFFLDPDTIGALASTTSGLTPLNYQCPLSLQEMLILLRNEVLSSWKTQSGVQGLYPITASSDSDNQFVAYVVGSTTASQGATGMLLPQSLVENLKALQIHSVHGKNPHDELCFVPILGQYYTDLLVKTDYDYTYTTTSSTGPTTTTLPCFSDGGNVPLYREKVKRQTSKGIIEEWVNLNETPISLIDGSAGGTLVFINDQNRLKQLTTLWNRWIQQSLSTYCDPLLTVGGESGPSILTFSGSTRYWQVGTVSMRKNKIHQDPRIEAHKELTTTVYSTREVFAQTYRENPYADVVQQFFNNMIMPVLLIQPTGVSPSSVMTVTRGQVITGEPHLQPVSTTGNQGPTLSAIHAAYATKMVFGKQAQKNEWLEFFNNASRTGSGGVLSGLLAGWAGKALGPTVGGILGGIADVLPV